MILEGIVTSLDDAGQLHLAPMGPIVDETIGTLTLRPFATSQTYGNLRRTGQGVFHVVDDVLLLARSAIGKLDSPPESFAATVVAGRVLAATCRWYEFEILSCDTTQERASMPARVVHTGRLRDFFGLNRAKHAVVEAAILATRLHLLPGESILSQLEALRTLVEKTGGPRERAAFELLNTHIHDRQGP
jgi:uncharacterized protein